MDKAKQIEIVEKYLQAVNEGDLQVITDLYADDAVVEDPVGSEPHRGKAAVLAFYQKAFQTPMRLERSGPVCATGHALAFPFRLTIEIPGKPMELDVIDVFDLNEAGKVHSMRAYWST